MYTFNPEKAKLEYDRAKNAPNSLCLITAQVIDWIIQQFKFWAQDFTFKSWETKVIPVKWKDLLQDNWSDVQVSIQKILNSTHLKVEKAA